MSSSCPIHIQSVYNHDISKCPKYLTINALLISITPFLDFTGSTSHMIVFERHFERHDFNSSSLNLILIPRLVLVHYWF